MDGPQRPGGLMGTANDRSCYAFRPVFQVCRSLVSLLSFCYLPVSYSLRLPISPILSFKDMCVLTAKLVGWCRGKSLLVAPVADDDVVGDVSPELVCVIVWSVSEPTDSVLCFSPFILMTDDTIYQMGLRG